MTTAATAFDKPFWTVDPTWFKPIRLRIATVLSPSSRPRSYRAAPSIIERKPRVSGARVPETDQRSQTPTFLNRVRRSARPASRLPDRAVPTAGQAADHFVRVGDVVKASRGVAQRAIASHQAAQTKLQATDYALARLLDDLEPVMGAVRRPIDATPLAVSSSRPAAPQLPKSIPVFVAAA